VFHVLAEDGLFAVTTRGYLKNILLKIPLGSVQKYPQLSQLKMNSELIACQLWQEGDKPSFTKVEGRWFGAVAMTTCMFLFSFRNRYDTSKTLSHWIVVRSRMKSFRRGAMTDLENTGDRVNVIHQKGQK
jgi:hypothetical protein